MSAPPTETPVAPPEKDDRPVLRVLPGDAARRIMWRYADSPDHQKVVRAARSAARGPVARLVADGARHSQVWNEDKALLLPVFDEAGLTGLFMEPEHGGWLAGPKNLALALAAFEMAWVDGGAATCSMAGHLALAPIHERGTPEQRATYMSKAAPAPGKAPWRGAFALTEPLPYVGVNTRAMAGTVRVVEWQDGEEPLLEVYKPGRFITNMEYANFVSAAVMSDDPRIKGSCMVILEETDPGTFDRGVPTRKLVHQLSSTTDPVLEMRVPASRIIGGYTVHDGVIVPNFDHSAIIAAVFRRTRVTVGLMTSGKLLSAVEPIIRYQRDRFRGGKTLSPGTPLHDMGLQQKEDSLHRLVSIWAAGEASASLGFATARLFDAFDPLEREAEAYFVEHDLAGPRARLRALKDRERAAAELVELSGRPRAARDEARHRELEGDLVTRFVALDALANVLCPAAKLWNTGHGSNMMRQAVSLMGGLGITDDCPGFLSYKWMDSQLEATYEGPEAVQRLQLARTMTSPVFRAHLGAWSRELREVAGRRPGTGACTVASAMDLWTWTLDHLLGADDADGKALYHDRRQGVTFPMADVLCWLLASRHQIMDLETLARHGADDAELADDLPGLVGFLTDLAHVQAATAAGEVARVCGELVFGYNRHPSWDDPRSCFRAAEVEAMEGIMPGIEACAEGRHVVIGDGGEHPPKAGPCVRFDGLETFRRLRGKLDGCMTGARLARDRAAQALTTVAIPEALDYPPPRREDTSAA